MNRRKTGFDTSHLIDLHVITDRDIEEQNIWAAKLTSTDDRAEALVEFDSGGAE
jgi:hypothetical protein